jgi:hypothetical protein
VYPVHVEAGQSKVWASAVAITKTLTAQHCHVVEGREPPSPGLDHEAAQPKVLKADSRPTPLL